MDIELRLVDPAAQITEARIVKFKRNDPRVAEIEGVIGAIASPLAMGQLELR